jgi:Fe-S-cluster-containing dehydrogenase component/DMSO reductase anchor subunit
MRKGFIFNHDLCVACNACRAACMLENAWHFDPRLIYSQNMAAFSTGPVVNVSMACNHCSVPACLSGCPSKAFHKNETTGAVILSPEKCIGCRYCTWNCPYDAPKFNTSKGIVEKCHFCYERLDEGLEPACSSSCPTGALSFGDIPDNISLGGFIWLPEKNINPSVLITGKEKPSGPEIIPAPDAPGHPVPAGKPEVMKPVEWSLVIFSFLTTLSVSMMAAGLFNHSFASVIPAIILAASAGFFSFFHLGSGLRAWRSLGNIPSSPLSIEILLFILYTGLLIISVVISKQVVLIGAAIAGLALLAAIDNIYFFAGGRSSSLNSGSTLLTGLLLISYFTDALLPFLFMAAVKSVLTLAMILKKKDKVIVVQFRIIRLALLIIVSMVMISGIGRGTITAAVLLTAGELTDRVLFYIDFNPLNIRNTILNQANTQSDEKAG